MPQPVSAPETPPAQRPGSGFGHRIRHRFRRLGRFQLLIVTIFVFGIGTAAAIGLRYQASQMARTSCLSSERRISTALLLYAQDHDSCLPPPETRLVKKGATDPAWRHWGSLLSSYLSEEERTACPLLPVEGAKERRLGYMFPFSYGLNERFFGTFGPGPFPTENLELPELTVLLTESGRFKDTAGGPTGSGDSWWIYSIYTDLVEQPRAYPAAHEGRMNVAAADGHVTSIKPASAGRDFPGSHDRVYGRLGGKIYNWNGGHPNGRTFEPPRE